MATENKYTQIKDIELPKGGGAYTGTGESFRMELFSGSAGVSMPLPATAARGLSPELTLSYQATAGNGCFGMGFSLDLPYIGRQTSRCIPRYDDGADVFLSSVWGELTPDEGKGPGRYQPVNMHKPAVIEYLCRWGQSQWDQSQWRAVDHNNITYVYGGSGDSVIPGPGNAPFQWLLREVSDGKGNRMVYQYECDGSSRYLSRILYGNYKKADGAEDWCFELAFRYEKGRADAFESYKGGFALLTDRLCTSVDMIHRLYDTRPVRQTCFRYGTELVSMLCEITCRAYDYDGGETREKALPPVSFTYRAFQPDKASFRKLELDGGPLPVGFSSEAVLFVDLYREGISGLLYSDGVTNLYYRPLGDGRYETPRVIESFPADRELADEGYMLTSLEGDGNLELVVRGSGRAGYYALDQDGWSPFVPFEAYPSGWGTPEMETVDMQGDSRQHLFCSVDGYSCYYPSKGRRGAKRLVSREAPADFPSAFTSRPQCAVTFAAIFGDGLQHRVRVTNGLLECWPNLGYGTFGERRVLSGAPRLENGFDARRVFFADVDGSGTADLLYAHGDRLDIYMNQGGRRFLPPFSIPLPFVFTNADKLSFADISGDGCVSAIFTKMDGEVVNYWLDISGGRKPYIMAGLRGKSRETAVEYESAAQQYLKDRQAGIPWAARPPFPIQVVSRIVETDAVTHISTDARYRYRHGYYDNGERRFMGFGYVEEWREERAEAGPGVLSSVRSRHWFYTGRQEESYEQEYDHSDTKAYYPPKARMEAAPGGESLRQAWLALSGLPLRVEMYDLLAENGRGPAAADGDAYSVTELLKPAADRKGSYRALPREHIKYVYEQNACDPRAEHDYSLDYDEDGNLIRHLTLYYPRRAGQGAVEEAGQLTPRGRLTISSFAAPAEGAAAPAGIVSGVRVYELAGFETPERGCDFSEAARQTGEAMNCIIGSHTAFTGGRQARLESCENSYYWDQELKGTLAFGYAAGHGLLHHTETAVLPLTTASEFPAVEERMLAEDCGFWLGGDGWYRSGATVFYDAAQYCQPVREESTALDESDALYRKTVLTYDPFALAPIQISRRLNDRDWLTESCRVNYRTMTCDKMTDVNDNHSEVILDEFGFVAASAVYSGGESPLTGFVWHEGGVSDILADKGRFIQGADQFYYYNQFGEGPEGQEGPAVSLCLENTQFLEKENERQDGSQCGNEGLQPEITCAVTYYDGSGRVAEERVQWEEGFCVKGCAVCDSGDRTIALLPPRFSDHWNFEDVWESLRADRPAVLTRYDAAGRSVKVTRPSLPLPDGSVSTVITGTVYTAWHTLQSDGNDLSRTSPYYAAFMEQYPKSPSQKLQDERDGLLKAAAFDGTPSRTELDVMGNPSVEYLGCPAENSILRTYNLAGKPVTVRSGDGHTNLRMLYTMDGGAFCVESSDTGRSLSLTDLYGQTAHTFDGEGRHQKTTCDALSRIVETRWGDIVTERRIYGETAPEGTEKNLRGRLWKVYGQDGLRTVHKYDLHGKPLESSLRMTAAYEGIADFRGDVSLEEEEYRETVSYDRLCRPVIRVNPVGGGASYGYDMRGNLASVCGEDGIACTYTYNEWNLETHALSGSGVIRETAYDGNTLWMTGIRAVDGNGQALQDLSYFYDLAGNITRVRNQLAQRAYNHSQPVDGLYDYTYDEQYRLVRAGGRELPLSAPPADFSRLESYTESYDYDGSGNLTGISHRAPSAVWTSLFQIEEGSNRLKGTAEGAVKYDGCGQPVSMPGLRGMAWDAEGRLTQADVIPREDVSDREYYRYDEGGQRVRRVSVRKTAAGTEKSETIYFGTEGERRRVWRGGRLVLDRLSLRILGNGDQPCAVRYSWRAGGPTEGSEEKALVRYQLCDHRFSVCVETDGAGAVVASEEYYPFGGSAVSFTTGHRAVEAHRYCGWARDSITGLYCYGARYYHSAWGRFISPDPMAYVEPGDGRTLNRYAYCRGNPITLLDRDGHDITVIYDATDPHMNRENTRMNNRYGGAFNGEAINFVPVNTPAQFAAAWAAVGASANGPRTVIVDTHGYRVGNHTGNPLIHHPPTVPGGAATPRRINIAALPVNPNIDQLLMLSCNAGLAAPHLPGGSAADALLGHISPNGIVMASGGTAVSTNGGLYYSKRNFITSSNTGPGGAIDHSTVTHSTWWRSFSGLINKFRTVANEILPPAVAAAATNSHLTAALPAPTISFWKKMYNCLCWGAETAY